MPALLLVDVSATQAYIFGSNALREVAGASHLVDAVTRTWLLGALPEPHNMNCKRIWTPDPFEQVDNPDSLAAEVVTAGGGGAVVRFRNCEAAAGAARQLTARVFQEAPGLHVQYRVHPYEGDFYDAYNEARDGLAKQKRSTPAQAYALPELSVTREGRSTGRTATALATPLVPPPGPVETTRYSNGFPAAPETVAKLRASWKSEESAVFQRLRALAPPPEGWTYALDAEDVTGTDESRRLAVVHADADGLGYALMDIGKNGASASPAMLRRVSVAVALVASKALEATAARLAVALDDVRVQTAWKARGADLPQPKEKLLRGGDGHSVRVLPFRPIVSGGDDVTFLTDARVGVEMAAVFCERFQALAANDADLCKLDLSASAGVAIVGVKAPFSRAYRLADALCQSAKEYRKTLLRKHGVSPGACMDWLEATGGTEPTLTAARESAGTAIRGGAQGTAVQVQLTMLPVTVEQNPDPDAQARSWIHVRDAARGFQKEDAWTRKRQQRLAAAHLDGPEAAAEWLRSSGLALPPPTSVDPIPWERTLYFNNQYPAYLDALALADRTAFLDPQ